MVIIIIIVLVLIIILNIIYLIYDLRFRKKKVNFYKCPHKLNHQILNKILVDYNYTDNFELYLPCGYNYIETELDKIQIPKNTKYIFGLKNCDKIVSKNNLWVLLRNTGTMPQSYLLPYEKENVKLELERGKILIGKKNLQRKLGLKIIENKDDLENAVKEDFKIAQVFLKDILLINERKVNLRVYLMIIYENYKLRFYVYQNGKCLYTNQKNQEKFDFESHITSFNMNQEIYDKNPHDFDELKKKINFGEIWRNIKDNLRRVCGGIAEELKQPNKFKDKVCFQLFGLDYLVGEDMKVYLLEINKGPDMLPKNDKDEKLKTKVYEDTFNMVGLYNLGWGRNRYEKIYEYNFSNKD